MCRSASSISWSRRGLLAAAGLGLAGCGFRPLHGPLPQGSDGGMRDELAAVRVGRIGERNGQLLRRDLQRRFEGTSPGRVPARYDLDIGLAIGLDLEGYRRDGFITRVRYTMTGEWVLRNAATPPQEIGRGTQRVMDAFNVPDLQFFAADSSRDAMERRLLEEMAEQIYLRVATVLRQRAESARA